MVEKTSLSFECLGQSRTHGHSVVPDSKQVEQRRILEASRAQTQYLQHVCVHEVTVAVGFSPAIVGLFSASVIVFTYHLPHAWETGKRLV